MARNKHTIVLDGLRRNQWDRCPGETGRAYEAFLMFREMGIKRTAAEAARMLGVNSAVTKNWSSRWDWMARAAAWDAKLAAERDTAAIEEARRMGERHARMGMRLAAVGTERLEEIATTPELRATLTPSDTIRMIKEGAELERTARGDDPDKGKSGTIIFNLNMQAPPKWSPASVVGGAVKQAGDAIKLLEKVAGGSIGGADGDTADSNIV